jgi:hypothetical protein
MTPLFLLVVLAQPEPSALVVTPSPPPRNLYRWQLLPGLLVQKPGDAVELYTKAQAALTEAEPDRKEFSKLEEELRKQRGTPWKDADRKRLKEIAEKFKKPLDLVHEAARREQANWDFAVDRLRKTGIVARLPEVEKMSEFLPLLVVRARLALLEDRVEEAVQVAATCLSLARQINECPTILAHTIAREHANAALDILTDCIQHPACPSLYGSLTDLPRSLLPAYRAYEGERIACYGTVPGLTKVVANPAGTELDADTTEKIIRLYRGLINDDPPRPEFQIVDRVTLGTAMQKKHDAAKEAMRAAGFDEETIKKTSPLNAGLLHAIYQYEEALGGMAAASMLPFPQARVQFEAIRKKFPRKAPNPLGPEVSALPLWLIFLPAGESVLMADLRLQQRLGLLRVAEGLRQHAAQAGKWPEKLADVKVVPLPDDPATGKPFAYTRDGDTITLHAPLPKPGALPTDGQTLRLTLRKPEPKP